MDFCFGEEPAIVEVALRLANRASEFEKDFIQAIRVQDWGNYVEQHYLIFRAGAIGKSAQPEQSAVNK